MIWGKSGRKKVRPGSGFGRTAADTPSPLAAGKRLQSLVTPLAFVILVAAITKLPLSDTQVSPEDIESQSIAQETIRADAERIVRSENLQATKEKQDQAAAAVPETYRVDRARVRKQLEQLDQRIRALAGEREPLEATIRSALAGSTSADTVEDVVTKAVTEYATRLAEKAAFEGFPDPAFLTVWLTPALTSLPERDFPESPPASEKDVLETTRKAKGLLEFETASFEFAYSRDLADLAKDGLEYVLTQGILNPDLPRNVGDRQIVVLREPLADQTVTDELPLSEVPGPEEAEDLLRARIVEKAKLLAAREPTEPVDWAKLHGAAFEMAKTGITDTLFFDQVDTEGARERARAAVAPVEKEIQPGEIIQRAGERWTKQSRADVKAYWNELQTGRKPATRVLGSVVAHMIFVGLALLCLHKSFPLLMPKRQNKGTDTSQRAFRNLTLALLLMCAAVILGRLVYYFEPSGFVLPVTSAAILLAILVHVRLAALVSFLIAGLVSIQYGYDWRLLVVGSAMSLAGAFSIFVVRRRSDMTRAALHASAVGLLVMLAITLATDSVLSEAALRRLALIGMNGAMCLLVVPGVLAPLERLFGITTDIQLLEYSDLNNEVLGRVAIEIPATYAHGLMLGQLAEAAADAIGANGLLARVCAYYHDIGKLRRPEYFSENQTGVNIHDELSPRLSARAIAAHVSQGVEIAREFHLPKPIIDGIREHHGTSLISFFYQEALEKQKHGDVREQDFRYPGPRPQSRETAILMICDAVESGVRSIKNPNEERVREFVDRIITGRSGDRQFDDCDLTLKELDIIGDVVARRVVSMLHTRVAYPETTRPDREVSNVIPMSGGQE